jgi:hypothetical protein
MKPFLLLASTAVACGPLFNPTNPIQVESDIYASDELGDATSICTISAILPDAGFQKPSGLLELNPSLNPNAEYELELQVANNGTSLGDDFHFEKVTISYIDIEGNLDFRGELPNPPPALVSGVAQAGGVSAVSVQAVSPTEAQFWSQAFTTSIQTGGNLTPGVPENVVVEVQILGVLSSGNQAESSVFDFPIQVCFNCNNFPLTTADGGPVNGLFFPADCSTYDNGAGGVFYTPLAIGHGPCCAPQDFYVACIPCGAPGGPCCSGSNGTFCGTTNPQIGTCTGTAPANTEVCNSIPAALEESATCPEAT